MKLGIYKLVDGSIAQKLKHETIANNVANANTSGFKRDILSFGEALSQTNRSQSDLTPGDAVPTGNPLDVALDGKGFFKVQTRDGIKYTRNGNFSLDRDGTLISSSGDKILGENGAIRIDGQEIRIETDGQVLVDGQPVGRLSLVDFKRPNLLQKTSASYFVYEGPKSEMVPATDAVVQQGYIENSNVVPTQEMVKMIESFRTFESAQRAIQAIDQAIGKIVNEYGTIS